MSFTFHHKLDQENLKSMSKNNYNDENDRDYEGGFSANNDL